MPSEVAIHSIHWQEWLNIDIGNPKRNIMAGIQCYCPVAWRARWCNDRPR